MVQEWLSNYIGNNDIKLIINSDPETCLSSGTMGKLEGIIMISGTGSITVGIDQKNSKRFRAGGWGPLLGDEGNGWSIGHAVLCAVTQSIDGTGKDTILLEKLKQKLFFKKNEDIIEWTYKDMSWNRIASLSMLADECHEEGDEVSTNILQNAAKYLFMNAQTIIKKMNWENKDNFTIVLAGSILTSQNSYVQKLLISYIQNIYPKCEITLPKVKPEYGAALLYYN